MIFKFGQLSRSSIFRASFTRSYSPNTLGSGAGRGGGGGGSIREAGGAFGVMEAAREEQYFYNKQREQLMNLKKHLSSEIDFHKEQIKRHEEAVKRSTEHISELEKKHK